MCVVEVITPNGTKLWEELTPEELKVAVEVIDRKMTAAILEAANS